MTSEDLQRKNASLRDKIEEVLEMHPELRDVAPLFTAVGCGEWRETTAGPGVWSATPVAEFGGPVTRVDIGRIHLRRANGCSS
jgi:hypothetical protein